MNSELLEIAPLEWQQLPIESVCKRVTSGGTPSRAKPEFYLSGKWGWVKTQELRDGWIDNTEETITDEALASSSAKLLPANTVLLALYGATVGQLGILRREMTCNQACCALIVDSNKADFRFLFYQLLVSRTQLKRLATGAAQQNLSGQLVKSFRLPFPPLREQQAIACVLGALDDKIELNRRRNRTLEAMARAIFQSWFVDFDPVKAKAAGRKPPGLSKEIAALFPDSFTDSPLGQIPTGWRCCALSEIATISSGGTPSKSNAAYWRGDIPWISPKSMTTIHVDDSDNRVTASAVGNGTKLVRKGAVLIMVRGMGLHDGVRISQARRDVTFNQDVRAVVAHDIPDAFLLYRMLVSSSDLLGKVHASGHGTGVLASEFLSCLRVVVPDPNKLSWLSAPLDALNEKLAIGRAESRTLAALRDTLLPKLISGELRVPDAERIVGRAV